MPADSFCEVMVTVLFASSSDLVSFGQVCWHSLESEENDPSSGWMKCSQCKCSMALGDVSQSEESRHRKVSAASGDDSTKQRLPELAARRYDTDGCVFLCGGTSVLNVAPH